MTEFYERSAWTGVARPVSRLTPMDASVVRGVAVHYTGSTSPLGTNPSLSLSANRLEQERAYHVGAPPSGNGWSDIAYQAAIDQNGRVFDCRGIAYRSAANGDATVNQRYGAITWLIGVGDTPSQAMIDAFKDWRSSVWLKKYPNATAVVGHRDLFSTECPGNPAYALVSSGALTAQGKTTLTSGGTDVPLTDAEIEAIAVRARDRLLQVTYGNLPNGSPYTLGLLWGELRINAAKAATGVDIEALASSIVAKLPAGGSLDSKAIASAVADELATRMRS